MLKKAAKRKKNKEQACMNTNSTILQVLQITYCPVFKNPSKIKHRRKGKDANI